jgi:hypothetical protein
MLNGGKLMIGAISGATQAQLVAQAQAVQAAQASQTVKPSSNGTSGPQDTVTISTAARAASQAQSQGQQTGGDPDHDGK